MSALIEKYNAIISKVNRLNSLIAKSKQELATIAEEDNPSVIQTRIANLEEQIEKIDLYLVKVIEFQKLASKNVTSLNVATIDAPEGYRVNLNRLKQWALLINPTLDDDPYAQRILIVAKCDELFLTEKRKEFVNRIAYLKGELQKEESLHVTELKKKITFANEELVQIARSEEVLEFAREVVKANNEHWYKFCPSEFINSSRMATSVVPGAYAAPFSFSTECNKILKSILGDCYDELSGCVMLPASIPSEKEYMLRVTCSPSRRNELDKCIQNLLFQSVNENPAGMRKVFVFDPVRYKSACLGVLRSLENTFVMSKMAHSPEQIVSDLEEFISTLADYDDIIELHDSVAEYNLEVEASKRVSHSTVVLYGWPNAFSNEAQNLVRRIIGSYERYGISIIAVNYSNQTEKNDERNGIPEYAWQNSVSIQMFKDSTTITYADGAPKGFKWYTFLAEMQNTYIDTLKKHQAMANTIGNEYIKRYPLMERPAYTREYKKIELPFGIDGRDEDHSISFENENFATYLVGASRSGKSTLLHTLIAGLVRNYHPDNLELWLADFKQLEFKRYINHRPPHVKYVLLDESNELVFDLIDKLTNEMLDRQKLFARLGVQRIDQVDTTKLPKPLPVIFVILDEFSIMSQSIADSDIYKLRLQNILAKGAALGIKFLFASQTFTTGVRGLTPTARAQIQQRIAMKGSKEEISETLELSSNLKTEQVRNWMDALPPHYALVKFRQGADSLPLVKRFLVMYFKDYNPRDEMIDDINRQMKSVNDYNPGDISTYVDKEPVLVDGNSINAFDVDEFVNEVTRIKVAAASDFSGDEKMISFGTPRLMTSIKPAILSPETRENILFISRGSELAPTASILMSSARSWLIQGGKVQIWTYERNRIYKKYGDLFRDQGIEIVEGLDNICDAIREMKKNILEKKSSSTLVILLGMERICTEFDYISGGPTSTTAVNHVPSNVVRQQQFLESGAVLDAADDTQVKMIQLGQEWAGIRSAKKRELKAEGKNDAEIKILLDKYKEEFFAEKKQAIANGKNPVNKIEEPKAEAAPAPAPAVAPEPAPAPVEEKGAYNAKDDFVFIMKQGSRNGYHFVLNLNAVTDIKACSMKTEFFRHKLAFQLSKEDARNYYGTSRIGTGIPEHICQYDDSIEQFSFRPYLHYGIGWEGWSVDENGKVNNPYASEDEE